MEKEVGTIHSIDRALDILLLLQEEGRELGVTQISNLLKMHKSTVHRTLHTLENKGFVQQNIENGKYWLGIRLYSLGLVFQDNLPLAKVAKPYVQELSERFQEGVNISVLDKRAEDFPRHIMVEKVASPKILSMIPKVGSSDPCHCSAVGKCLLAFAPANYIERFRGKALPAFTPKTIVDWDALERELALIRTRGYALDDEELEQGLSCVASPILGRDGIAVAAVSISGPTSRIRDQFESIAAAVMHTAKQISSLL